MELTKVREKIAKKKITENIFSFKPAVKNLLSFAGGFIFMNPFVLGRFSPFSLSLTAALDGVNSICSCAGGILGAFVFFDGVEAVKYTAVNVFFVAIRQVFGKFPEIKLNRFFDYISAFLCSFFIGLAIMLASGAGPKGFLEVSYESALTCVAACIFRNAREVLWEKNGVSKLSVSETAQIITLSGIFLMHFYKYKILSFSPVVTVFCLLILIFSRLKNEIGGALSGLCLSAAAGLSGEFGLSGLGLALGGLASGMLARKSRLLCALGFFIPVLLCAFADGSAAAYMTIAESLTAVSVFLIVPERFFTFLCAKVNSPASVCIRNDYGISVSKKLLSSSAAIGQISDCVTSIRNSLKTPPRAQLNSAVISTWQRVCRECEIKDTCPDKIKNPSAETADRIVNALLMGKEPEKNDFSNNFSDSCCHFSDMCSRMRQRYEAFTASLGAQGEISQAQAMMSDQFRNISEILKDLAADIVSTAGVDTEAADCCAAEAREFGLDVISADGHIDRYGRFSVSLSIIPDTRFDVIRLTDSLSAVSGTVFNYPEIRENNNCTELIFSPKITFDINIGAYSRPKDGEAVCGDYFRSFRDESGRYTVILSDGMGTGTRAAIDSAMAAELFTKLVRSGLSFDCALPIVNSALIVKSSEESLSTLDAVCIDLYSGKTEFLKAGAAATFIRHRGRVIKLEQESMPLGILSKTSLSRSETKLEKGDIILMVSDGIQDDSNGWIKQKLKLRSSGISAQKFAEEIVNSAAERNTSGHRDDMTAVAVYIK